MLAEQQELPVEPAAAARKGSPTIQGWSVVGYDRIVGMVHAEDGARGKAIMTSPVLRVSFLGSGHAPIALTQSGSLYALGNPAEAFGTERAQHFLQYKAGDPQAAPAQPTPRLPTSLMKIEP